ncbi:efflux RND transporter periplasmic adaptor subunit [Fundidesulfovibrio butyratiphilus]
MRQKTVTHIISRATLRALLLGLACAALAVTGLSGCRDKAAPVQARPVVKTMRLELARGGGERTYSGVVVPRHEVREAFRVGGRIEKRLVDVGDRVRQGQDLAVLDDKDLRLSMESAQAERMAATTNRDRAVTDEKRFATLLRQGVVSQSDYDQRHLAADEARSRLERAERSLDLARRQLGYARLLSSGDGVVTAVSAEPGQVVAAGQTVVSVARKGDREVLVDIPESRLADLRRSSAEVTLWADDNARHKAVLREVAPAADAAARTYAVRYVLPDADSTVRLGMTATLHLSDPAAAATARVPLSAVFDQGGGPGLWIVDPADGSISLRPVTVDHYTDSDAYVRGRLKDGEVAVTAGVQKLDPGVRVRLEESAVRTDAGTPEEAGR